MYVLGGLCQGIWWWNADLGSNSLTVQVRNPEGVCPPFAKFGYFVLRNYELPQLLAQSCNHLNLGRNGLNYLLEAVPGIRLPI